jgi:hypothetical protein
MTWMTALGHEEQFLPPSLSAGFGFIKKTFAGTRDTEQDAPTAAIRGAARLDPRRKSKTDTSVSI